MVVKRPKIGPWMLKKEIILLYYALQDKRTSLVAKMPAIFAAIYLLSPVDLVPDFIPFFGYIDDIIVVPLLLNLAIRLLPQDVREESLLKSSRNQKKMKMAFFGIIILVIAMLSGIFFLIRYLVHKR
jgi:uncharacterized membrane protein YkvA (DUF1232 family)